MPVLDGRELEGHLGRAGGAGWEGQQALWAEWGGRK